MKIFVMTPDSNSHHRIECLDKRDLPTLGRLIEGRKLSDAWRPVLVRTATDPSATKAPSDFPSWDGVVPVFSERAAVGLRGLLEPCGDLLPLASADVPYYAFNITAVLDVLDEERAELKRFSDGTVMRVIRYAFRPGALSSHSVFRIPQRLRPDVYVTEQFVSAVTQDGFEGFSFREVGTN